MMAFLSVKVKKKCEEKRKCWLEAISPLQGFRKAFNPLPDDKIFDWSKLKQIADDILKCI